MPIHRLTYPYITDHEEDTCAISEVIVADNDEDRTEHKFEERISEFPHHS